MSRLTLHASDLISKPQPTALN